MNPCMTAKPCFLNMVEIFSVPEPSTWAVFGMGILTLALVFKKRQVVQGKVSR